MIKTRSRRRKPPTLDSAKVRKTKQDLARRVAAGERLRECNFPRHWSAKDIRRALWKMQCRKCCYCERQRDMMWELPVEHFRPKASVAEMSDHPGYWWLAYDWTNYFLSCNNCNSKYKKDHFPLLASSVRALRPKDSLEKEKPVLINPELEDPEQFIQYEFLECEDTFVKAEGKDPEGRGKKTIEILGLNRDNLLRERAELVLTLKAIQTEMMAGCHFGDNNLIQSAAAKIRFHTSCERSFTGFRRHFFRVAGLGEYIINE